MQIFEKKKRLGKEEAKILFSDDVIFSLENAGEWNDKLLELIKWFSKVAKSTYKNLKFSYIPVIK